MFKRIIQAIARAILYEEDKLEAKLDTIKDNHLAHVQDGLNMLGLRVGNLEGQMKLLIAGISLIISLVAGPLVADAVRSVWG